MRYFKLFNIFITEITFWHLIFLFYNGGAGEQRPHGKVWFGMWVIAPPACCLVRSSRRLAGVQPAPPLLWMRSVQSNYLFKEHYMHFRLKIHD